MAALLVFALAGCDSTASTPVPVSTPLGDFEPSIPLTSPAFVSQQPIPKKYSCDGDNVSPPLDWGDTLPDTKSFALIMDDPDTSDTYVHWVIYNIPSIARSLPEGVPASGELADGSRQGNNGSGKLGYGGPCPPSGTHHYNFKLYALNITIDLPAGATKSQLEQAMAGHVLAYGELVGTYSR